MESSLLPSLALWSPDGKGKLEWLALADRLRRVMLLVDAAGMGNEPLAVALRAQLSAIQVPWPLEAIAEGRRVRGTVRVLATLPVHDGRLH